MILESLVSPGYLYFYKFLHNLHTAPPLPCTEIQILFTGFLDKPEGFVVCLPVFAKANSQVKEKYFVGHNSANTFFFWQGLNCVAMASLELPL